MRAASVGLPRPALPAVEWDHQTVKPNAGLIDEEARSLVRDDWSVEPIVALAAVCQCTTCTECRRGFGASAYWLASRDWRLAATGSQWRCGDTGKHSQIHLPTQRRILSRTP